MPKIRFTSNLKRFYPKLKEVSSSAESIKEALNDIERSYPGISDYIIDDSGQLRKHVNIFIGDELVKDRVNLNDSVCEDDVVYIMQALSGG